MALNTQNWANSKARFRQDGAKKEHQETKKHRYNVQGHRIYGNDNSNNNHGYAQTDYLVTLLRLFPQIPQPFPIMTKEQEPLADICCWSDSEVSEMHDLGGLVTRLSGYLHDSRSTDDDDHGEGSQSFDQSPEGNKEEEQRRLMAEAAARHGIRYHQSDTDSSRRWSDDQIKYEG